jgi:shikimate dehydrogenase
MTLRITQRVGLIGWPVEHSLSPVMHNAAFAELGLDWRYELLPTSHDQLAARLEKARREYRGANVTVPHKQQVLQHLDHIDETAAMIGAVNTISMHDGELVGHNTDAVGFLTALIAAGFAPAGQHALLLGAGGAARAVASALAGAACAVTIYNRRPERAVELAKSLGGAVAAVPAGVDLAELELTRFDLLVNATPVGMWPAVGACPWPEELPLPARWTVYDLIYNPSQTQLLDRARAAGATTIGGLEMLVHQGALAFALWTSRHAPIAVMRAAATKALRAARW